MGAPAYVTDVRFLVHDVPDGRLGEAEAPGIIVSPHIKTSHLGYERTGVASPWPIAAFRRRRHRGTVLVIWSDIDSITTDGVHLQSDYIPYSPVLP